MKLLWVATKPPWPVVDGGRLLMDLSLRGLSRLGVEITLVAPVRDATVRDAAARDAAPVPGPDIDGLRFVSVHERFRPRAWDLLRSWPVGRAFSMARHSSPGVAARVRQLLRDDSFDAVHLEQVQAAGTLGANPGPPIFLRAQNVESDLWRQMAPHGLWPPAYRQEARLLARAEGLAVRRCVATAALTEEDADALARLADGEGGFGQGVSGRRVEVIPPPFPARLPSGDSVLPGDPALVVLAAGGWIPNRQGLRWWLEKIWPGVRAELPNAVLHIFGTAPAGDPTQIQVHPPPKDSRDAFAPGSILVVPLQIASGIRMKILESWARGVPVIATPRAASGLGADSGEHLWIASTAEETVDAIQNLRADGGYDAMVASARELLAERYDPDGIAGRWLELYGRRG